MSELEKLGDGPADGDNESAVPMKTQEFDALVERLYPKLRTLASQVRWRGPSATQPTSLLHEAYLKLRRSRSSDSIPAKDILLVFAHVMRQVMVDAARRTKASKRGAGAQAIPLAQDGQADIEPPLKKESVSREEILTLDIALKELREIDPRQAEIVDFRYFLGLTAEETAAVMDIGISTVEREWRKGRAFLSARIEPARK